MNEFDRDACDNRRLCTGRRREVDEQRPQTLASRGETLGADVGDDATVGGHGMLEMVLQLG
jgi:hypothetical protein